MPSRNFFTEGIDDVRARFEEVAYGRKLTGKTFYDEPASPAQPGLEPHDAQRETDGPATQTRDGDRQDAQTQDMERAADTAHTANRDDREPDPSPSREPER